jgi:transcriptional regulator with GAF, ATPase, and Fis domain
MRRDAEFRDGRSMADCRAWYWFFDCPNADYQRTWLDALSAVGLRCIAPEREPAGGPGLVFFSRLSSDLCEFMRAVSARGVERVLAIAPSRKAIADGAAWTLLQHGAADVIAVNESAPAVAAVVMRQLERWRRVDAIVASPLVRRSLVGESAAWRAVLRQAVEAALFTDAPVLITGETGTGKELIARLIHTLDPRPNKGELILVDCPTISRELAGSEFFGHERGAFTGALAVRDGAFALADGGTLFLDEVGELPLELQAELLRAVQEGTYKRVGGNQWRSTRFRLVTATNRDPSLRLRNAHFRQDFFHRITSVHLRLPPLRERADDILPLARSFLQQQLGSEDPPPFDECVVELLLTRDYPGNVRDLKQLVARIAHRYAGDGGVTPGDIPEGDRPAPGTATDWRAGPLEEALRRAVAHGVGLKDIADTAADTAIRLAIQQEGGDLAAAAERLHVTRRALELRRQKKRQADDAHAEGNGTHGALPAAPRADLHPSRR